MKKSKFIILAVLLLALITVFVSGCREEGLTKVKVSEVTHSIFYAPQYAAISQGFFEEEGLEVELTLGDGNDKVMTGVLSGQVDIGFSGSESTVYVYNEGRDDYAITFAQLTQKDGSFLVGREPDPDFTFDKLKGKDVIGGHKSGMLAMTFDWVLKKNGIDAEKDLNMDNSIHFSAMAGAFQGGQGDYVTLFEPVATAMEKEGTGYVVASIGNESGIVAYTAYNARKSFIEENPEIIQKFTNAIYKGQLWVEKSSYEEIAKAIHEFFPEMEIEDLIKAVKRYKDQDSWSKTPVMTKESFETMQDIVESAGVIDKRGPYDKLVNIEFAEKAVEQIK
ncbi:ABC transporter substrate-binding protein [Irregularibacter muris]|uniref:ABC transporter substrate-binding protein n=1 Tax=Irregularibacter muris TaxID=1796619 RepID=A0AAE3HG61_9FIRM|nr:ABC transporter substrate-binding protein [Irregularibacter muris]MCR1900021.1 ABC transporter substrate-binding protein [Irregularibacter muris]